MDQNSSFCALSHIIGGSAENASEFWNYMCSIYPLKILLIVEPFYTTDSTMATISLA